MDNKVEEVVLEQELIQDFIDSCGYTEREAIEAVKNIKLSELKDSEEIIILRYF